MMKKFRFAPFLLLATLAALTLFRVAMPSSFKLTDEKSPLFKNFPLEIGTWKGEETEVDERTLEILETRNVLSRNYTSDTGRTVHLLLVASKKDRRVAHPPEVCYVGSNYQITHENQRTLHAGGRAIPVKEFTATHERRPEDGQHVVYVYKIGEKLTTSYYAQQIRFALDRLTAQDSEVLLIRVAGSDQESIDAFLPQIINHLT